MRPFVILIAAVTALACQTEKPAASFSNRGLPPAPPSDVAAVPAPAAPTAVGMAGSHGGMANPHGAASARPAPADVNVPRAEGEGAATIAEIFGNKATLAGKQVTVRGKVVKVNTGIMGKNWLHLQDGSGSQTSGDHDLTVTTSEETAVGDVVTMRGPLSVDRDFGAGYAYPVILEDARLVR
jgi:hypothetical protein